ncbi:MAG: hypothetical protein ACRDV7_03705 [Acidimicrobiia bacterium]
MADEQASKTTKRDGIEIFATVLLALAAVATAWSGYQANRWNGEQVKAGSRTNALRIDAARAQGLSEAETQIDVATFIQWVDAFATQDELLQDFYEARFRPDFQPAFDAWIATDPFENPDAPLTPFRMPEYEPAAAAEAAQLDDAAAASAERVQRNLQRSANYVLAVVLFAVTLFFAGISTKLRTPRLRAILLIAGYAVFFGTVVWLATFPVSLSV